MDEDDKWAQKARLRLGALKKSVDDDEDLQDAIGMSLQNPGEADAIQAASLLDSSYQSQAAGPGPGGFLSDAQAYMHAKICSLEDIVVTPPSPAPAGLTASLYWVTTPHACCARYKAPVEVTRYARWPDSRLTRRPARGGRGGAGLLGLGTSSYQCTCQCK